MHMCTHIVSFIEITATSQEKAGYVCVACHYCSQEWSVTPLHMKRGDIMECSGFNSQCHVEIYIEQQNIQRIKGVLLFFIYT